MSPYDWLLFGAVVLLCEVLQRVAELLEDLDNATRDAAYWQGACRRSYGLDSLSDAKVAELYHGIRNGFKDERKQHSPLDSRLHIDAESDSQAVAILTQRIR